MLGYGAGPWESRPWIAAVRVSLEGTVALLAIVTVGVSLKALALMVGLARLVTRSRLVRLVK